MLTSGHLDGGLKLWSIRDGKLITEMKQLHDEQITSVLNFPDGKYIITNSLDNSLKLLDIRMHKEVKTFEHDDYFCSGKTNPVCLSPGGKYAAVGSKNGKIVVFDVKKGDMEEVLQSNFQSRVHGVAWSKMGRLASIDANGILALWS